jgi:hypothetical protein
MRPLASRRAFAAGTTVAVVMAGVAVLASQGLHSHWRDVTGALAAVGVFVAWHVLASGRNRVVGWWWLQGAPYLTLAAGWVLLTVAVQSEAHYEDPQPRWEAVLGYTALPLIVAWPAAWLILALRSDRGRG